MGNIFSISLSCDTFITRCWDCAAGQAGFICKLEENLDALKTELAELKDLRNDVIRRVNIAEDQQQLKRLDQVQGWLLRAETVINEVDLLIVESPQEINKLCMGGCCSTNPRSNHKFGKQIAKKLQEVKDQNGKGVFNMVADKVPIPPATKRPSEPTVGLESTFNKVWSSLPEDQVGVIGLYGLGGVGKTTLLNQINNKFLDACNDFDHVIWVVASQDLQIGKVQEQIGKRIGFLDGAWKYKSLDEKAADILSVLYKKKFALLLDDIWEWIDLTRVGVPLPTQENGSKIIFTTRLVEVCFQMGAHKKIKVECLPQVEALKLFEEKVGAETLDKHPDIRKSAEEVAKECAGLPLALITIGRAMASKKTPEEWKYAVDVLRQSTAFVFRGVGKEMYPKLKFSYDCLSDGVRSCFLYCSLYPEDFLIEKRELIHCWIGEGFLDEHTNLNSIRNQGYYIIGSLIDACLLEEETNDFVKMHDVIRDMALWIAGESDKENFFVQAGVQLKEQPVAEKWEMVRRVSLMENQIENLTEILECPNLQTLFLGMNKLKLIINDFFKFMPMLRVLDLSRNQDLEELPVGIAKLVSLEHLNLSDTKIRKLPLELKVLEELKYLNLEYTWHLEMIPRQLISSFSNLQVLKMYCCDFGKITDLALEGKTTFRSDEWLVEEIECLKYLNVLTISFKSASMLERALVSYRFQSCAIETVRLEFFRGSRLLNIFALANMQHLEFLELIDCDDLEEVKIECTGIASGGCFHSLQVVKLIQCSKLRDGSWVILALHLKHLFIHICQDFEEIICQEKLGEVAELTGSLNLFSKLEVLSLCLLPKMKTIYWDALPFPQLKEINIIECPMLRRLPLNSDSAKGQKIFIIGEEWWWKDVEWEDESTRDAFLPSFKPLFQQNAGN